MTDEVVHRFDLTEYLVPNFNLVVPEGAQVVYAGVQDRAPNHPCVWMRLNPEKPKVEMRFHIVGTGMVEIDPDWQHVATWQDVGYVWHLFQEPVA